MILQTILITSIMAMLILVVVVGFSKSNILKMKKMGEDKELNSIVQALPSNKEICESILNMLNNNGVNIKCDDSSKQACLYVVASNSIFIANINNTFARVQTVAHECIHSIQDKRMLWFNFIFSNIYLLFFLCSIVLTIAKVIINPEIFVIIFLMMSFILYCIRSFLEIDAMVRARYVAERYLNINQDKISKEEVTKILENYDEMNKIGIKFYACRLALGYLAKVAILCMVGMI